MFSRREFNSTRFFFGESLPSRQRTVNLDCLGGAVRSDEGDDGRRRKRFMPTRSISILNSGENSRPSATCGEKRRRV